MKVKGFEKMKTAAGSVEVDSNQIGSAYQIQYHIQQELLNLVGH
jgi:hypothetical protein